MSRPVEFSFGTAWLVWKYEWDYGPENSECYFYPSSCRVFLTEADAETYAKEHGGMDVDEISLQQNV